MTAQFAPVRVSAPGQTIVSLQEVKAHCRIDSSEEDTYLSTLIDAATSYLDGYTGVLGRALLTQSWRQDFNSFEDELRLPIGPVASITSISYRDQNDAQQNLSSSVYSLLTDEIGSYVSLNPNQSWPAIGQREVNVQVTYVAGSATVPPPIKLAALFLIAGWFSDREVAAVPSAVTSLIQPFRVALT